MDWNKFWREEGLKEQKRHIKTYRSIAKGIDKIIKLHNYKTILDVGCGAAEIIKFLAKSHLDKEFIGYDISSHIIKLNKKTKLKNLHFHVKNITKMPNKKFDLVLCFATLHYSQDPIKIIKNLLKVINTNGSLIINYPNKLWLQSVKKGKLLRLNYPTKYLKKRLNLAFNKKNLITFKQIKDLNYPCKIVREKQPGNKYVQIIKSN